MYAAGLARREETEKLNHALLRIKKRQLEIPEAADEKEMERRKVAEDRRKVLVVYLKQSRFFVNQERKKITIEQEGQESEGSKLGGEVGDTLRKSASNLKYTQLQGISSVAKYHQTDGAINFKKEATAPATSKKGPPPHNDGNP